MLDRYFQGEVKRISPEAPVPVTRITKINSVLGGAANVAANLAHLECQVFMGGVTGDDENRLLLEKLMDDAGINHQGLVKSNAARLLPNCVFWVAISRCCDLILKKPAICSPKKSLSCVIGWQACLMKAWMALLFLIMPRVSARMIFANG